MSKYLLTLGLILGYLVPVGLASAAPADPSGVYQQEKCKAGEKWDPATKKCVKK